MPLLRTIALLCLTAATACTTEEGPATVDLSWRFTDGRACDLAGIVDVAIRGAGPREVVHRCWDGLAPRGAVDVDLESLPTTLELRAKTLDGAVLYRGESRVETSEAVTVSLGFVGGE